MPRLLLKHTQTSVGPTGGATYQRNIGVPIQRTSTRRNPAQTPRGTERALHMAQALDAWAALDLESKNTWRYVDTLREVTITAGGSGYTGDCPIFLTSGTDTIAFESGGTGYTNADTIDIIDPYWGTYHGTLRTSGGVVYDVNTGGQVMIFSAVPEFVVHTVAGTGFTPTLGYYMPPVPLLLAVGHASGGAITSTTTVPVPAPQTGFSVPMIPPGYGNGASFDTVRWGWSITDYNPITGEWLSPAWRIFFRQWSMAQKMGVGIISNSPPSDMSARNPITVECDLYTGGLTIYDSSMSTDGTSGPRAYPIPVGSIGYYYASKPLPSYKQAYKPSMMELLGWRRHGEGLPNLWNAYVAHYGATPKSGVIYAGMSYGTDPYYYEGQRIRGVIHHLD